jgi:hypothetical protein
MIAQTSKLGVLLNTGSARHGGHTMNALHLFYIRRNKDKKSAILHAVRNGGSRI